MYRGWGARLLRAMVQLSLDRAADAYEEIRPPTIVKTETMISTGHLPKFAEDAYHMERDDLWAIPDRIKSLNPRYRLYFGHHSPVLYESVYYASDPNR